MARNLIEVGLKLHDDFSKGMEKAAKGIRDFEQKMGKAAAPIRTFRAIAQREIQGLGNVFRGLTAPIRFLQGSLFNLRNVLVGFAAFRFTEFAVGIEDTRRAFDNLNRSMGEDGTETLRRLRAAFRDTVSDMDLMQTSNRAILLGAAKNSDELELMATLARRLGKAMGRDLKDAFGDLALGIGRQSRLILDNLGIIVRVEDATEAYARQVGKTADALTDAEKRQAFMNAVIEGAERRIRGLGEDVDTLSDSWRRLTASVENLGVNITSAFGPLMRDVFERLSGWLETNRGAVYDFFSDFLGALEIVTPRIIAAFERIRATIQALLSPLGSLAKQLATLHLGQAQKALPAARNSLTMMLRSLGLDMDANQVGALSEKRFQEILREYESRIPGWRRATFDRLRREYQAAAPEILREYERAQELYLLLSGATPAGFGQGGLGAELGGAFGKGQELIQQAKARSEAERQRAIYEEMNQKRLQVMEAFRFGPPALTPTPEAAGPPEAVKSVTELDKAVDGLKHGLGETMAFWQDSFSRAADVAAGAADSFGSNFADEFTRAAMGAQSFGDAFQNMAKGILSDISRMILKLGVMRLLMSGLGALGIEAVPLGTPAAPAARGGLFAMAGGGQVGGIDSIIRDPTVIAGERGAGTRAEAYVPLPDGRHIPVALVGGGGGQVVNYYSIEATDAQSFDKLFRQSAARNGNIIGNVHKRQYQDRPGLRRGYS